MLALVCLRFTAGSGILGIMPCVAIHHRLRDATTGSGMKLSPPLWLFLLPFLLTLSATAQPAPGQPRNNPNNPEIAVTRSALNAKQPDKIVPYRKTEKGELTLHFFLPPGWKATDKRPGIVFFFGGGFRAGAPNAMYGKAAYLASRGLVAISADYRTKNSHGVNADAGFADGRSALRYVRAHASEFGLDPDKLLAGGSSSGGEIAASLAYGLGPDNPEDDKKVSPVPAALVLFNPAVVQLNNTALIEGTAEEKLKIENLTSPMVNLKAKGPPMILFYGTEDWLLRPGRKLCEKAISFGTQCELYTAAGQQHAFINASPWHEAVIRKADEFLTALGYLTGDPTMKVDPRAELVKILPPATSSATDDKAVRIKP